MMSNNFINNNLLNILAQIDITYIDSLIILTSGLGILSIGSFILYSAQGLKQGAKNVGKILAGLGVGGSIYTGGKEVGKDIKDFIDKSKDTSKTDSGKTEGNSGSTNNDSGSKAKT